MMIPIKFSIKRREKEFKYSNIIIPVLSVVISLTVSELIFIAMGFDPTIFPEAIYSSLTDYNTLRYSIPLILCGVGLSIAYKANVWNIGAEGQMIFGAIAASALALYILPKNLPNIASLLIIYSISFLAGALIALIAAVLKALYNVNEVLTTLMLNYIAIQLGDYLVYGPWRGSKEYGYPRSDIFPMNTWAPQIPGTAIHYSTLIIAIAAAIILNLLLYRSSFGFEVRVVGSNPSAARHYGISISRIIILTMVISGGLAGVAGAGEVIGVYRQFIRAERISAGFGYTAIIVAWLANLNPIANIISGFFLAILTSAGYTIQIYTGLSYGSVNIITGLLLITLVSLNFLIKYKPVITIKR